jgi:hypothetical protein
LSKRACADLEKRREQKMVGVVDCDFDAFGVRRQRMRNGTINGKVAG